MEDDKRKIGILGGSFQPIHNGHITMALSAKKALDLDTVLLVPAKNPPHKELASGADDGDRLNMLNLVCGENESLLVENCELLRVGKSYTSDTLRFLAEKYTEARLFFIMGEDMLKTFAQWHEPEIIASLASLVTFPRGSRGDIEDISHKITAEFHAAKVFILPPVGEVSSTEIREKARVGESIRRLVPDSVEEYIFNEGLYLPDDIKAIFTDLKSQISTYRFCHTLGVMKTALSLAQVSGIEPRKARLAALLHDCAKEKPRAELEEILREYPGGDYELSNAPTALLHAPAGAVIARDKYGIVDEDILRAISLHTTADEHMSSLQKIIYIADRAEPGRIIRSEKDGSLLKQIRAEKELDRAFALALFRGICYSKFEGITPSPATMRAINEIGVVDGESFRDTDA
jgi:nicotinate-nucleotide adenylyltransferase